MGRRTNTVLQTCFFALSGVLPPDEAIAQIKKAIAKTYGKKGEQIVQMNFAAVDAALAGLHEVKIPAAPDAGSVATVPPAYDGAPEFVRKVTARLLADKGDLMPVSAIPLDGCWPTGTSRFEKRNIALEIPVWDPAVCIQCNKCVLVCPHAAIRAKFFAAGGAGRARRRGSSRRPSAPPSSPASATPSRWRPRTAPAARSASRSARPRTGPTRGTRRSTWCRSRRCSRPSAPTGTSS